MYSTRLAISRAAVRTWESVLREWRGAAQRVQCEPCASRGKARSQAVQEMAGASGVTLWGSGAIARQVVRRSSVARDSIARKAARIRQVPPQPIFTGRLAATRL